MRKNRELSPPKKNGKKISLLFMREKERVRDVRQKSL